MYTILRHRLLTSLLLVVGALGVQSSASASCGEAHCTEVSSFKAVVTDFRTSQSRNVRIATATLRVTNRTARPLVLGYVQGSGVVIDDQGNRYEVDTRDVNNVRAIGVITGRTFDPKFSLQPGASGDARLQFSWYAGNQIAGTVFQLELTIREIDSVAGDQFKLGREHAVQFRTLVDGFVSENAQGLSSVPAGAVPAGGVHTSAAPTAAATNNPDVADPCSGLANCSSAGVFTAQVTQLTASQVRNVHLVRINMRFRNITNQPLILAYTTNSGSMIDNYGNRYTVDSRARDHVKGIGQTSRNKADPQFVLSPGESRNATFEYTRYIGKTAIGTVFTPDLAIEQLEILPSQQIRSVREYSLSFANLSAGTMVAEAGEAANAVTSINEAGKQLSEGLKSLFKKK